MEYKIIDGVLFSVEKYGEVVVEAAQGYPFTATLEADKVAAVANGIDLINFTIKTIDYAGIAQPKEAITLIITDATGVKHNSDIVTDAAGVYIMSMSAEIAGTYKVETLKAGYNSNFVEVVYNAA